MAGGTHPELGERERLAALTAEGLSLRAIARALGRAASTVGRELRRDALPGGGYLPVHAEGCYRERRQRRAVLERDERLRAGAPGAAGGGPGSHAPPSPSGAPSTTGPRASRGAGRPGTGKVTC